MATTPKKETAEKVVTHKTRQLRGKMETAKLNKDLLRACITKYKETGDREPIEMVCEQADFSGQDFSGLSLAGKDLSGENLHGVKMVGTNLSGANLTGADLTESDLTRANMKGIQAERVNFTKATLTQADARGANFKQGTFIDATLILVDFRWALLTQANARGSNWLQSDLTGSNCEGVIWDGAILNGVKLDRANCSRAFFGHSKMERVGLRDTNVENAHLLDIEKEGSIIPLGPEDLFDLSDLFGVQEDLGTIFGNVPEGGEIPGDRQSVEPTTSFIKKSMSKGGGG